MRMNSQNTQKSSTSRNTSAGRTLRSGKVLVEPAKKTQLVSTKQNSAPVVASSGLVEENSVADKKNEGKKRTESQACDN